MSNNNNNNSTDMIKIGVEEREVTTEYSNQERDLLGRDLATKTNELADINKSIENIYIDREQEILALEKQKQEVINEINYLQEAVRVGQATKRVICDVYEDDKVKIIVTSGSLPTDENCIVEIINLPIKHEIGDDDNSSDFPIDDGGVITNPIDDGGVIIDPPHTPPETHGTDNPGASNGESTSNENESGEPESS